MPRVEFTPNLQRHVLCPPCDVAGATVAEVLEQAFASNPSARGYVLDETGALRRHMTVFVDGGTVRDRERLTDPVGPGQTVLIMQALSGG